MKTKITVFASYEEGPEWAKKAEHIDKLIEEGFPIRLIPFLRLDRTNDNKFSLQKFGCEDSFYMALLNNENNSTHFVIHLGIGIRMRLHEFYNALNRYIRDRKYEIPFIFENTDLNFSHLKETHQDYKITSLILEKIKLLNSENPSIEKMIFGYKNEY